MGISLKASVANAVSRWTRRHRSDLYTMIEEAIYKQRSKMKTREDVSVFKFTADVFKPRFSTCNTCVATLKLYFLCYTFQVTLHSIWRKRNNRRHGSHPTPAG
ncbi:unnamed protein product, partial [Brassica oleracea]